MNVEERERTMVSPRRLSFGAKDSLLPSISSVLTSLNSRMFGSVRLANLDMGVVWTTGGEVYVINQSDVVATG